MAAFNLKTQTIGALSLAIFKHSHQLIFRKDKTMTKITLDDFYQPQHATHPAVRLRHIVNETHHNRFAELKSVPEFNPDLLILALWLAGVAGVYDATDWLMELCDRAAAMPPSVAVMYIEGQLVAFVVNRVFEIVNSVKQTMERDTTAAQEKGKLERYGDIPPECVGDIPRE